MRLLLDELYLSDAVWDALAGGLSLKAMGRENPPP